MMKSIAMKPEAWVAWLGTTVAAAITGTFVLMSFAYGQFETKEHAKERGDAVQVELKGINDKLDRILGYDILMSNRTTAGKKSR